MSYKVTIEYVDYYTNESIIPNDVYDVKSIAGYEIVLAPNDDGNRTIVYKFKEILGSVTVKYMDIDTGIELLPSEVFENLKLGNYTFEAKSIEQYNLVGDASQIIQLTESNLNPTIVFYYKEILGSVIVSYVDSDTGLELIPSDYYNNLKLGSYSYEAKTINQYDVIGDNTKTVQLTVENINQNIIFIYKKESFENMEKIPYISTYYFNPKPTISDEVKISFYITNYAQAEYMLNTTDLMLDVSYEIDGGNKKTVTLPAGDNEINLGKLSVGEHYFSLQAVDRQTGLKSHELFNEILVIDPATYNITVSQTYTVTDTDLKVYSISKDNSTNVTNMVNTRIGLTKLFLDLQVKGYRKCILPNGIYRVDNGGRDNCISIPTKFTVDMNGSTFKLDTITQAAGAVGCIVRMYNTYDSHLVNGILEGDRFERKALGLETSGYGEAINTFYLTGSKYSTLENLTVKATTGHTIMSVIYTVASAGKFTTFTQGLVINGENVVNNQWSTTEMKDITKLVQSGYIAIGTEGGYRGVKGKSLAIYMNFYDANQNFLEMMVGYQYRRTRIPQGAKYVRVSLMGTFDSTTSISAFNRELGTHWAYKNISFIDTRTTAIATTSCSNLLVEGVTFTRCGWSITPAPVDFEDGWQECQDVYFRNSSLLETAAADSGAVIDNAGFNHVYENNTNFTYTVRYSVVGLVLRNHTNLIRRINWVRGYQTGSAYGRVYNIICNDFTSATDDADGGIVSSKVKNSTIKGSSNTSIKTFSFEQCTFYVLKGQNVAGQTCNAYPQPYLGNGFVFKNSKFYNIDNINNVIKFSFNAYNAYRQFDTCSFLSPTQLAAHNQFNSGIFTNCTFEKDVTITPNYPNKLGDIQFNNCIFKANVSISISDANCFILFNGCTFLGNKTFSKYGQANSVFQ